MNTGIKYSAIPVEHFKYVPLIFVACLLLTGLSWREYKNRSLIEYLEQSSAQVSAHPLAPLVKPKYGRHPSIFIRF
jgi:hypothetical protein